MSKKDTAQFWGTAHRYLDHQLKVIRQVSSHTVESYRDCLNSFIDYLERVEHVSRKRISFHNFEKETLKRYQTWIGLVRLCRNGKAIVAVIGLRVGRRVLVKVNNLCHNLIAAHVAVAGDFNGHCSRCGGSAPFHPRKL